MSLIQLIIIFVGVGDEAYAEGISEKFVSYHDLKGTHYISLGSIPIVCVHHYVTAVNPKRNKRHTIPDFFAWKRFVDLKILRPI